MPAHVRFAVPPGTDYQQNCECGHPARDHIYGTPPYFGHCFTCTCTLFRPSPAKIAKPVASCNSRRTAGPEAEELEREKRGADGS